MSVSSGLAFHITMGTVGLLSGAAAMAFAKGSRLHRAAGNVFFVSLLAMAASATYLAIMKPFLVAGIEGMLAFYWVATGWLTVMRAEGKSGVFEYAALFLALTIVTAGVTLGLEVMENPKVMKDGIPAPFYFFFAGLAALSAAFDVKVILRGGIAGAPRIARHLWRMSAALTISAGNLFIGNPQVFPMVLREAKVLPVPVLLAFALLIFWLIRVRFTNWYGKTSQT